jgi:hypothetical protein
MKGAAVVTGGVQELQEFRSCRIGREIFRTIAGDSSKGNSATHSLSVVAFVGSGVAGFRRPVSRMEAFFI